MVMTVPNGKTIVIKCNDNIIFKDDFISFDIISEKTNKEIIDNLIDICTSSKGMHYVLDNMDFVNAGYKIEDMIFIFENKPCNEYIGCNKKGIHKRNEFK